VCYSNRVYVYRIGGRVLTIIITPTTTIVIVIIVSESINPCIQGNYTILGKFTPSHSAVLGGGTRGYIAPPPNAKVSPLSPNSPKMLPKMLPTQNEDASYAKRLKYS